MNGDLAREMRRLHPMNDARALCGTLGLGIDGKDRLKQARGLTVRCPVHGGLSCSVTRADDGTVRVKCFGCDFSGDAVSLVAAVRGLSLATDFREVLRECAQITNHWDALRELEGDAPRDPRPAPTPAPARPPEPIRTYPDQDEVRALLDECAPVSKDQEVSAWLDARGVASERVDGSEVALALNLSATLPRWATYQRKSWIETGHRLIFPVYDDAGELRSVRAGRVTEGDTPKRLPPAGHRAAGLVVACTLAVAMLRGTLDIRRVVICEGETDFLSSLVAKAIMPAYARLAITSGSWSQALADRIPTGAVIALRTDNDAPGEKYASEIIRTLGSRCDIRRKKAVPKTETES